VGRSVRAEEPKVATLLEDIGQVATDAVRPRDIGYRNSNEGDELSKASVTLHRPNATEKDL
jgi:hypothetical protein